MKLINFFKGLFKNKKKENKEKKKTYDEIMNIKINNRKAYYDSLMNIKVLMYGHNIKSAFKEVDVFMLSNIIKSMRESNNQFVSILKDNEDGELIIIKIMNNCIKAMKDVFKENWEKELANPFGFKIVFAVLPIFMEKGVAYLNLTEKFFKACFQTSDINKVSELIKEEKNNFEEIVLELTKNIQSIKFEDNKDK